MKTFLKNTVLIIIGIAIGCSSTLFLSKRASSTYLDIIKMHYQNYEEQAGRDAIKNGQYLTAIHHLKNLVNSSSEPTLEAFKIGKEVWTPMFPFSSEVLKRIQKNSDPDGVGAQKGNGINRGLLAYALEKNAMYDQAENEWKRSTELLGITDRNKTKKIITEILNI